jgi:hypothetical protein
LFQNNESFESVKCFGGIVLGIPNYFPYIFAEGLENDTLNASVFTVNNVAIVMFSTLLDYSIVQRNELALIKGRAVHRES